MAYGRNDRDLSSHGQDDDRQRLTCRWSQDEESGSLRRHFDEDGQFYGEYGGNRRQQDRARDDRSDRGARGGYFGEPDRRPDRNGGHIHDFASRDYGRSALGNEDGRRAFEGQERFGDLERHGDRSVGSSNGDRENPSLSNGLPEGGWPREGGGIVRYVSAEGHASMTAGSFRGKGPKGYFRSDERIREDVSDRLGDDDTLDASEITVEVSGGEVTLSGYVDSRRSKRSAEDCAGVTHVQNNVRVRAGSEASSGSTSSGALFSEPAEPTGL